MPTSLFLDTTIHIDRILLTEQVRSGIQQNLVNKRIYTSSTVYMKFKRTVLQDIRYIYALIERNSVNYQNSTISHSDISQWLGTSNRNFSMRSLKRCIIIKAFLEDAFPTHTIPKHQLLSYLRFLESEFKSAFFHIKSDNNRYFDIRAENTYIDVAGCVLSRRDYPPKDILHERLSCSASTTECQLNHFLAQNVDQLHAIHQRLSSLSKSQRDEKAFNALTDVLTNGYHRALGERNCWAMGDIVIALE
ncbi:MAG: hypothetical protein AAF639_26245, partial [Chloroflexota bacterium]